MDHLQLLGETEEELQKQMQVVRNFIDDIHTEFGPDKCEKIVLKMGKLIQSQNLILDFNRKIQELEQRKTYKYLRIEELKEAKFGESLRKKSENKLMHGRYIRRVDRQLISEGDTFLWLSRGDLNRRTESEIIAAQDQALHTKYLATDLLPTEIDNKCRHSKQVDEKIGHIISACPILTKEQYIKRHGIMCARLCFNMCKEIGVKLDNKHRYDHLHKSVEKIMKVKLPYYGTNKCKPTELFPTKHRAS
jgi:hypothetical protein